MLLDSSSQKQQVMIKNYLKIVVPTEMSRSSTLLGFRLAWYAACSFSFSFHESSYDQFHKNADNIYRVLTIDEALGVSSNLVGITMPMMGAAMETAFPEVVNKVRMLPQGRQLISHDDQVITRSILLTQNPLFRSI